MLQGGIIFSFFTWKSVAGADNFFKIAKRACSFIRQVSVLKYLKISLERYMYGPEYLQSTYMHFVLNFFKVRWTFSKYAVSCSPLFFGESKIYFYFFYKYDFFKQRAPFNVCTFCGQGRRKNMSFLLNCHWARWCVCGSKNFMSVMQAFIREKHIKVITPSQSQWVIERTFKLIHTF